MPEPGKPASRLGISLGALALVTFNHIVIMAIVWIWPEPAEPGKIPSSERFQILRWNWTMTAEEQFLVLSILAGALGSLIHLATSFADFVGNRTFVPSWTLWYILRPVIGMTLGLILYFVVRGGLVSPATGAQDLSPYGVAAISALAGMFSRQATDKLREVFENLFATTHPPKRSDSLGTEEPKTP